MHNIVFGRSHEIKRLEGHFGKQAFQPNLLQGMQKAKLDVPKLVEAPVPYCEILKYISEKMN